MKTRIITGTALVIFFIPIFYFGGLLLDITLGLLSVIATYELFRMFKTKTLLPNSILIVELLLNGMLFFLGVAYFNGTLNIEWLFYGLALVVIIDALLLVFNDQFEADDFGRFLLSVIYPVMGFCAISALNFLSVNNILFLFMITIMTDIFAYVVGVKYGKHPLAPKISPKKTIEGSIGGMFFAVVFTLIFIYVLKLDTIGEIELNIWISIILILSLSIFAQIGDLIASKLKRSCSVKDYSNLFPGHGGVMDRFDSVMFAAIILLFISEVVGLL